jgi:hypothetical protein
MPPEQPCHIRSHVLPAVMQYWQPYHCEHLRPVRRHVPLANHITLASMHQSKWKTSAFMLISIHVISTSWYIIMNVEFHHSWDTMVKGTVSRDLSSPFFFIKQLLLVPIAMSRNDLICLKYSVNYSYS